MPKTEKQRLRRKAKARSQRLHPQPGALFNKIVDTISEITATKVRP